MARQIDSGGIKDDTYVVSEGLSVADSSKVDDDGEGESDAPAVFLCGKCRLPFGDSLSWAGSDDLHNQILLKRTFCPHVVPESTDRITLTLTINTSRSALLADRKETVRLQ